MPLDPSQYPAIAAAMQPTGPSGFPGASQPAQAPVAPSAPPATAASPGIGGAIMDAVKALAAALAPKSITGAGARQKANEQQAEGQQPASLGQVLGQ
jgi:hypothetical protein